MEWMTWIYRLLPYHPGRAFPFLHFEPPYRRNRGVEFSAALEVPPPLWVWSDHT